MKQKVPQKRDGSELIQIRTKAREVTKMLDSLLDKSATKDYKRSMERNLLNVVCDKHTFEVDSAA